MNRTALSLLAVLFLLTSCGQGSTPSPSPPSAGSTAQPPSPAEPSGPATPTLPPPTVPPEYQRYEDQQAGFAIHFPAEWVIASQDPGNLVILQSFAPAEAGGEGIPAGETKCDVIVRGDLADLEGARQQLASEQGTEILSEAGVTRADGGHALAFDVGSERVGEYGLLFTVIDDQVVSVSCLGDQEAFDAVSSSLQALSQ